MSRKLSEEMQSKADSARKAKEMDNARKTEICSNRSLRKTQGKKNERGQIRDRSAAVSVLT